MNKQFLDYLEDVEENRSTITNIRLIYKKLGPIEAQYIAKALHNNTSVTTITLESNMLGDRGAQIIASALKLNTTVTELNVAANGIRDDGFIALADLVRTTQTLETLRINHNTAGIRGATALADALKVNKSIKKLNVSRSLPPEGFIAIVKSLVRNNSLQSLNLSGVDGGTQGAIALGESLKSNTTLRLLNLTDCAIEKEGVAAIVAGVKENSSVELHSLILKDNPLPTEVIDKVDKLLNLLHTRKKKATTINRPTVSTAAPTTPHTNATVSHIAPLRHSQMANLETLPNVYKHSELSPTIRSLANSSSTEKAKFKLPLQSTLKRSQGEELISPTDQHRTPPSLVSWVLEDVDER